MPVAPIPAGQIERFWPVAAPLLAPAIARAQGDWQADDVHAALLARDLQLWLWLNDDGIATAAGVTTIDVRPRRAVCVVMFLGGRDRSSWQEEALDTITTWARAEGCTAIEGHGRPGWLRVLRNTAWRTTTHTLRQEF